MNEIVYSPSVVYFILAPYFCGFELISSCINDTCSEHKMCLMKLKITTPVAYDVGCMNVRGMVEHVWGKQLTIPLKLALGKYLSCF